MIVVVDDIARAAILISTVYSDVNLDEMERMRVGRGMEGPNPIACFIGSRYHYDFMSRDIVSL
jgi:hypothetical protein